MVEGGLTKRIEKLEAQVNALQQLLLSHVLAFDTVDRFATDATIQIVRSQRDSMLRNGRQFAAVRVDALVEDLQKCRD